MSSNLWANVAVTSTGGRGHGCPNSSSTMLSKSLLKFCSRNGWCLEAVRLNLCSQVTTSETLDEFDDEENVPTIVIDKESEESCIQLNDISHKTTTGERLVSDGESIVLVQHCISSF
ncbi:hypothetical protein POM88_018841 [Heracleum sosnowskyi]|uniref:Uncharacterized protein n=1 Tax=Heracleum sosnowskyi TaxID=360622 RepID=A0AAD8N0R2_9APIA|nr:hypothetical protein POM88_018841 [Heracleum sosnowskyi]